MARVTGDPLDLHYSIELDHGVWVPVPLELPWNGYDDLDAWAADVASALLEGAGAPAEVEAALRDTALVMARTEGPFPGAIERFWHFPDENRTERLAHLYVAEYPGRDEAAIRTLATAGIGGYVQVLEPLDDTGFEVAARTVVVAQPETGDQQPILLARFIGLTAGVVFIVEAVEADPAMLYLLLEPVEALFRSIQVGEAPEA